MTQYEDRHDYLIRELSAWPKRDGTQRVGGLICEFRGDQARCGNVILLRREWQHKHWRALRCQSRKTRA